MNLYRTLLKALNIPLKDFVSHYLLPSPDQMNFWYTYNKKPCEYVLPTATFRLSSIVTFHTALEVTLTSKLA